MIPNLCQEVKGGSGENAIVLKLSRDKVSQNQFYFFGAFFLPATVLRLPLRVRLLVRVR